mmetsp:Transcript_8619/g.15475  ORF Transcript_8619/g.15475 Transcript_8619/m.15475 type:complete len:202 (-) Transcript_8619:217-822(-)
MQTYEALLDEERQPREDGQDASCEEGVMETRYIGRIHLVHIRGHEGIDGHTKHEEDWRKNKEAQHPIVAFLAGLHIPIVVIEVTTEHLDHDGCAHHKYEDQRTNVELPEAFTEIAHKCLDPLLAKQTLQVAQRILLSLFAAEPGIGQYVRIAILCEGLAHALHHGQGKRRERPRMHRCLVQPGVKLEEECHLALPAIWRHH